jgi:prepilin-type N-terminal cleavage/methylation domain-containing protein
MRMPSQRQSGLTLIEIMVVLGIIAVLALLAGPSFTRWQDDQRVKAAARAGADLLLLARSEAIRTGNQYVVYFGPPGTVDPAGTDILNVDGGYAPMLALADGPTATANCRIDVGEDFETIEASPGLAWGVAQATVSAPNDNGSAPFVPPQSSGHTFADPGGTARDWVMFRPDGMPVVFDGSGGDCGVTGATGTGGAALYITNGRRDYGVVLSPLGSVRVHVWDGTQWSS